MQPENPDRCPICRNNTEHPIPASPGDFYRVQCGLCREYTISTELCRDLPTEIGDLHPHLTAATSQASEAGTPLRLTNENWRNHADAHKHGSVRSAPEKLLRLIQKRTGHYGAAAVVKPKADYPLIDGIAPDTAFYFLDYIEELGFIKRSANREVVTLTPKGWEHLDPGSGGGGIPGRVFVAMSFHPSLAEAYSKGIKPAIEEDCGLEAVRVDEVAHNEKICDRIFVEIRRCQFVVADYSQHRGGVYFEDGFAMGLGREVVRTCQQEHLDGAHFDTRQYPYVTWSSFEDLRSQLADRIKALNLARRH